MCKCNNFVQTDSLILFYRIIAKFIESLYQLYTKLYFTYLEINPLVVTKDVIYILDLAAKLDSTADFVCRPEWGEIDYPPPFGRDAFPEEAYIADLDAKSGASLKVSIKFHPFLVKYRMYLTNEILYIIHI
jgi:succinyl-CoA synthetase beta subunit